MSNQEKLDGFIFMCNRMTKPECYRFRVFGLPAGRREVVEKIHPGAYLFLFDTDVKLLYGIYMATSSGQLRIEPLAFGQRFPAQVSFKIYQDCLPLPENCFKQAIEDNYQKDSNKFTPELSITQVRSLLALFRPLPALSTVPRHPILKDPSLLSLPPANNVIHQISRPSLSQDAMSRMSPNQVPWQFNYRYVNELDEPPPPGYSYPAANTMASSASARFVPSQASRVQLHPLASQLTSEGTYGAGRGRSFTKPMPDPHYTHQNIVNPQPEIHSSVVNRGSGHPQSWQDPQHAHHNILHSQPEIHSSMGTMGNSHTQPLQDPQYPQQSIQNPPSDFHSGVVNVGSSHVQSLQNPHYTHQNIPNQQPDSYSSMINLVRSYGQSLPDPQYPYQNNLNLQPDFNSSTVNMDHANLMMQSQYYPYVPQEVGSATNSYQWPGAIQGVVSSNQQVGTGAEYYQPSMQTNNNIATQENAVRHYYLAGASSQPVESHAQM
ncbi:PREDICTED: uncharacterized protein LOC109326643 isoform X1 [Lupinus angustifolius]|nr:PREDICTED: uncharacterized protein LOC109326643 isoform X1 [Lupinus angustifolius]XP_019414904.1 PREDICTED: uncharacterized protein LOC109326643 isoform X1 [Lupinus angustifolius]XP_019414905.1 PREDICTED: uncharacterized protein LOC109326643 isoform X1 [Lupinus angustifolius]